MIGRQPAAVGHQRGALVRLIVVGTAAIVAAVVTGTVGTVTVVLALVVMIMVHELGHLLAARLGGMKVSEYFLGFGPRIWSIRRGETEYGIKAIPAGGYVKIPGMTNLEEVAPEDESRTYREAPFKRRLAVAVAGSLMHFVMAFVLLWSLFAFVGTPDPSQTKVAGFSHLGVPDPAYQAGMRPGDVIVSVDGHAVGGPSQLAALIRSRAGQPAHMVVNRNGARVALTVTPIASGSLPAGAPTAGDTASTGVIGVQLTEANRTVGPVASIGRAGAGLGRLSWDTVTALAGVASPHGVTSYASEVANGGAAAPGGSPSGSSSTTSQAQSQGTSGGGTRFESPIGIVRLASQAAHGGIADVLNLLILINVFVGLFNMIPMLPLDGGHVVIAVYERLRSRRGRRYHADVAKLLPATYAVVLVIVVLAVTSVYLDVTHPLPNPFQ